MSATGLQGQVNNSFSRQCPNLNFVSPRFYEDFYRVVVQNEKFEDWFPTLTLLRQTFTDYKKLVLEYHHREGFTIPTATNSTAAQGNFLEVLNISLNTFEKHFINRNLDRTGQQAIVVTPGAGIFEVDRDLTVITKQRIIDSGVGSDLICVGEQPLHAVPLFKMHTRGGEGGRQEDFSMPHWINLSFYTTQRKIGYSSFVPRIKLPPLQDPKRGVEVARSLVCFFPAQGRGEYISKNFYFCTTPKNGHAQESSYAW